MTARLRTALVVAAAALVLGAVAVGVPLALHRGAGSPAAIPEPPELDAAHCPVAWPVGGVGAADRPGPLVPADGVVSVTLCELPGAMPSWIEPAPPRVLTARAGEVIAAMNALPSAADGNRACTFVAFPTEMSLVVSYAGRAPVAVLLDRNCGTAGTDGRTRRITGTDGAHPAVADAFLARYREQLAAATSPAAVKTPACEAALSSADIEVRTQADEPRDDFARNRGGVDAFAPSALVEVRACRYRPGHDGLRLATQHAQRQDLAAFHDLVNAAAQRVTDTSDCATAGSPTTIDVVWLADATGAVAELRVPRQPCPEFRRAGFPGLVAPPQLLVQLDHWLT
ncbi:hypothetical protein [Dactylosporangium sp. NPDC048998]|uniref:hypothetical protein n=1 Tax=Dactylosporangium sp. NPDC048998 TaxID=3363976 RepID=UPI00371E4095